jgi:hypothetical protein
VQIYVLEYLIRNAIDLRREGKRIFERQQSIGILHILAKSRMKYTADLHDLHAV